MATIFSRLDYQLSLEDLKLFLVIILCFLVVTKNALLLNIF